MANYDLNSITHGNGTYNLKDNSKIPLSGTNALSGSIVPDTDNAYNLGSPIYNFRCVNTKRIQQNDMSDFLFLVGGSNWNEGASIALFGKNNATFGGTFRIDAHNGTDCKRLEGTASGTLTWNGQSIQTTSDKRLKQQITEIDDKLLDAWEDVELSQFKYNDAVDQKGKDNARLHTGYVVQQIDEACKSHNVDISEYGLYCHEEYPEETREVEHEDGTKTIEVVRPASEHYSLRYTETLVVECAYLRKKNKELENTVLNLQTEIADLKSVIAELKTTVQGNQKS